MDSRLRGNDMPDSSKRINPFRVGSIQKRGIWSEIKACEKFDHRHPEGSALGVHMVDIPRINPIL